MKKICILGSTGSIGTQALDVIRQHHELFEVHTLTAYNNAQLLIQQAREFLPDSVVIVREDLYQEVSEALDPLPIKVYTGSQALCEVVTHSEIDIVLTAMVGFAGLRPTIAAINAKKTIALANKETLVVAGELICNLALQNKVPILPVDSEHSAILQSLTGEGDNKIEKILLTASGGPFRTFTREQMKNVTPAQALRHPNWEMGAKITIDSATLMNKGFEMIEAKWLFDISPEKIEVVVHPESIIHSAVQFEDGSVKAQLGVPDMRLPIQYAFTYPARLHLNGDRLDLFKLGAMHFEPTDMERFPCLRLSYEAISMGGTAPCVLNAANEIVNLAFREGKISYPMIAEIIEKTMQAIAVIHNPTLEQLIETDEQARIFALNLVAVQEQ
ncbi:MAG: 1-deoxy-D-xylulose-5-phosphate reductoisomerase [Bacteroidaceae bacterium]|nr:1-deoxy-D-xylulose-5-phosphate reductoisomerase [Bacteroidaceae bacterium]